MILKNSWIAVDSCLHGAAGFGRGDQGLEEIRLGMVIYQGLKTPPIFWSMLVFNQAQAYLANGQPQEGLSRLVTLMDAEAPSNEGALIAEFFRLMGNLLLAVSRENAAQAAEWFQQAIDLAKQQKARLLELRAAVCLARLWRDQGKEEQAQSLLEEVYNLMTEGFDIPDMRAARKLLDDLSLFR